MSLHINYSGLGHSSQKVHVDQYLIRSNVGMVIHAFGGQSRHALLLPTSQYQDALM